MHQLCCALAGAPSPWPSLSPLPLPRVSLLQEAEALETEAKAFEDLEFQQLEKESRLEEEREVLAQQLLHCKAESHRTMARRKVSRLPQWPPREAPWPIILAQLPLLCLPPPRRSAWRPWRPRPTRPGCRRPRRRSD